MNHASLYSFVVPVFPATVLFSDRARQPVPYLTTSSSMDVARNAICGLITLIPLGWLFSRTFPSESIIYLIAIGSIFIPPCTNTLKADVISRGLMLKLPRASVRL